jgi:hypothetical protein
MGDRGVRFLRQDQWGKLPLLSGLACALVLAVGISLALAGKGIESGIGQRGSLGLQFETPRDVAVYNGAGDNAGDIFVVDDANHRIQRLNADGTFDRAWGADVDSSAAGANFEVCTNAASCKAGVPSAGNTADNLRNGAMDNPQGIAVDQTTGAVYVRDRDNRRVQQFDLDGNFVRAWGWDVVRSGPGNDTGNPTSDPPDPANEFEICVAASGDICQAGAAGTNGGQFGTSFGVGGGIAIAPATGDVFVADPTNRRVQQFRSNGTFVRLWGWDVVQAAQPGNIGPNDFEICPSSATGVCKGGVAAADPAPSDSNGQFGSGQPLHLAVDSASVVYASDSISANRVMRFDSTKATASTLLRDPIGTPPLATAATNAMEVDPTSDNILIGRGTANIQELDTTPLRVVDTHLTSTTIAPTGIGIDASDGEILVSSTSAFQGTIQHRVYVLDDIPTEAMIEPVTNVTADGATFHGTVDPNDSTPTGSGTARFEYTSDPATDPDPDWRLAPLHPEIPVDPSVEPVPVSARAFPLEPGTEYRVRLVAMRGAPLGGSTRSSEALFSTDAAAPTIASSGATPGATSAILRGRIHPQGQPTTYRFEYGLTDSYGSVVPVPDGAAGTGDTVRLVEESISGLEPSTTYHFRLVAENGTGRSEGPDRTFTTGPDPDPGPVARVYEKVSPEDKNGGDTQGGVFGQTGYASPSGDAVVYSASQPFDDAASSAGLVGGVVRAARRPTIWANGSLLPPKETSAERDEVKVDFVSEDLSRALVRTNAVLDAGARFGDCNLYLRDNDALSYEFIASAGTSNCGFGTTPIFAPDATPDLSTVLVETGGKLFRWNEDGGLTPASVLPNGAESTGSAGFEGVNDFVENAISDDGSVVYFSSPPASATDVLYRRSGTQTVAVSKEENPQQAPCGTSGVCAGSQDFEAASSDGSRVFFTSPHQLVAEDTNSGVSGATSGTDLYMYTHSADPDNDANLTLLSQDLDPAPPDGAEVLGVLGVSDDGSRVYFAAENQIVAGADPAPADIKFYVWDEDEGVRYIGGGVSTPGLGAAEDPDVYRTDLAGARHLRSVSPDGKRLILLSSIPLAGDDNGNGGVRQAYLYDYGADEFVCVTCPSVGERATGCEHCGNSLRGFSNYLPNPGASIFADDGRRVFFQGVGALVPEDTNGKADVYMWERGGPHLISTGKSEDHSLFVDASASGDDVFFGTRERLVPWDVDNLRDLYVASVGGGLPDPRAGTGAPCSGDACQGAPAGHPSLLDPLSDLLRGLGDLAPGARASFAVRRLSRAQLSKLARGGRVMLPVRVNRAGKVSLTARAKLGKRRVVVDRSARRATKAGTVRVPLRLSKAARGQLARKRKLSVSVSVRFTGVREPRALTLRLRRAAAPSSGRAG